MQTHRSRLINVEETPPHENDSIRERFDITPEAGTDPGKISSMKVSKPSQAKIPEQSDNGQRARVFPSPPMSKSIVNISAVLYILDVG